MPVQSQRDIDEVKLYEKINDFPWYVVEFVDHKANNLSPSTLLGYLFDYEIFFGWLISEAGCPCEKIKDIPLYFLENLDKKIADSFPKFLVIQHKADSKVSRKKKNSEATISRKMAALKSLFSYLQNEAEDGNQKPLLTRNVITKIKYTPTKIDIQTKADIIQHKILDSKESVESFRRFVASDYSKLPGLNKRHLSWYEDNRERDTAIISLILGSGLRVNEVATLTLGDIDWSKRRVLVKRKSKKKQSVPFSIRSKLDLEEYMNVRGTRYKPSDSETAFFLTKGGKAMTKNAMQKMVLRYSTAYGKRLSVHKLRHTFATELYKKTKDTRLVQDVLGHAEPKTTAVYTHIGNDEQNRAIDGMDGIE
ncbi:tyrosine recombinase XerS [Paenibacillus alginolyticus]|uniref:tyrosine recombinase XerS n=1 Tax=Paenibacillus alginolyticus TaxID=59839 RepID=UPI000425D48E|nr:tyrosine recombinase XerS [Paenibacillus alginolyticus]MCY9666483.1 tyrosine recombinase XerS [Paenibacillus alginolyticus]